MRYICKRLTIHFCQNIIFVYKVDLSHVLSIYFILICLSVFISFRTLYLIQFDCIQFGNTLYLYKLECTLFCQYTVFV